MKKFIKRTGYKYYMSSKEPPEKPPKRLSKKPPKVPKKPMTPKQKLRRSILTALTLTTLATPTAIAHYEPLPEGLVSNPEHFNLWINQHFDYYEKNKTYMPETAILSLLEVMRYFVKNIKNLKEIDTKFSFSLNQIKDDEYKLGNICAEWGMEISNISYDRNWELRKEIEDTARKWFKKAGDYYFQYAQKLEKERKGKKETRLTTRLTPRKCYEKAFKQYILANDEEGQDRCISILEEMGDSNE